jgi:large subunit ribosomal protein L31e
MIVTRLFLHNSYISCTLYLIFCSSFKNKAPRALKEIKKFASAVMGTKDVRVDTNVNKFVWSKGVRNVPHSVRVQLSRKRNEDEEAKEKTYTLVTVSDDTRKTTVAVDE